ncbi:nitric oxide synthase-interacting protein [Pseudophryne corroboree]|uniref:nitric oxide synthase-interacting protein n=1 Tax=Pseudophryne corroboree TaxID=495146 RepID=UPI00308133BC
MLVETQNNRITGSIPSTYPFPQSDIYIGESAIGGFVCVKPYKDPSDDKTVYCPMSGRPLKMKDLVTVKFTLVDAAVDRVGLINRQDRYVCAVTRDMLGNSVPCAVLRPSGAVVTLECVEKLLKKDMTDPVSGDKLSEKDIIVLQRGGTGFSGSGVQLEAKEARPVMQA